MRPGVTTASVSPLSSLVKKGLYSMQHAGFDTLIKSTGVGTEYEYVTDVENVISSNRDYSQFLRAMPLELKGTIWRQ